MSHYRDIYGEEYDKPAFYVSPGVGENAHTLGGTQWNIAPVANGPSLFVFATLDFTDKRLDFLGLQNLEVLPLCVALTGDLDVSEYYFYDFDADARTVTFQQDWYHSEQSRLHNMFESDFEIPIPETSLELHPLPRHFICLDEETYDIASSYDRYSKYFFRVGSPVFTQDPVNHACSRCDSEMEVVCCLGDQLAESTDAWLESGQSLDIKDLMHFFLVCPTCSRVHVAYH